MAHRMSETNHTDSSMFMSSCVGCAFVYTSPWIFLYWSVPSFHLIRFQLAFTRRFPACLGTPFRTRRSLMPESRQKFQSFADFATPPAIRLVLVCVRGSRLNIDLSIARKLSRLSPALVCPQQLRIRPVGRHRKRSTSAPLAGQHTVALFDHIQVILGVSIRRILLLGVYLADHF